MHAGSRQVHSTYTLEKLACTSCDRQHPSRDSLISSELLTLKLTPKQSSTYGQVSTTLSFILSLHQAQIVCSIAVGAEPADCMLQPKRLASVNMSRCHRCQHENECHARTVETLQQHDKTHARRGTSSQMASSLSSTKCLAMLATVNQKPLTDTALKGHTMSL